MSVFTDKRPALSKSLSATPALFLFSSLSFLSRTSTLALPRRFYFPLVNEPFSPSQSSKFSANVLGLMFAEILLSRPFSFNWLRNRELSIAFARHVFMVNRSRILDTDGLSGFSSAAHCFAHAKHAIVRKLACNLSSFAKLTSVENNG